MKRFQDPDQYDQFITAVNPKDRDYVLDQDSKKNRINFHRHPSGSLRSAYYNYNDNNNYNNYNYYN